MPGLIRQFGTARLRPCGCAAGTAWHRVRSASGAGRLAFSNSLGLPGMASTRGRVGTRRGHGQALGLFDHGVFEKMLFKAMCSTMALGPVPRPDSALICPRSPYVHQSPGAQAAQGTGAFKALQYGSSRLPTSRCGKRQRLARNGRQPRICVAQVGPLTSPGATSKRAAHLAAWRVRRPPGHQDFRLCAASTTGPRRRPPPLPGGPDRRNAAGASSRAAPRAGPKQALPTVCQWGARVPPAGQAARCWHWG